MLEVANKVFPMTLKAKLTRKFKPLNRMLMAVLACTIALKSEKYLGYLPKGLFTLTFPATVLWFFFGGNGIPKEIVKQWSTTWLVIAVALLGFHFAWIPYLSSGELVFSVGSYVYFFGAFFFPYILLYRANVAELMSIVGVMSKTGLAVFSVESIVRLFFPSLGVSEKQVEGFNSVVSEGSFYQYKYGSIIAFDSNFVALICSGFLLTIYLSRVRSRRFHLIYWTCLLLLTFSRSAIFSVVAAIALYEISKLYGYRLVMSVVFFTVPFFLYVIFSVGGDSFIELLSENDGSLGTKLEILAAIARVLEEPWETQFFGFGYLLGQTKYSFQDGFFAHSAPALLLGVCGILGAVLYLLFWLKICARSSSSRLLMFFVLISGFSLFPPFDYLFMFLAALLSHNDRLALNNKISSGAFI